MKQTLHVGSTYTLSYTVPPTKTVPHLYPESELFQQIPAVFATGFMVGLIEWCCIEALTPHLEAHESSLGTFIETTHSAPTPVGMEVEVVATCREIKNGNNIFWDFVVTDAAEEIARGVHGRHVIDRERFHARVAKKRQRVAD